MEAPFKGIVKYLVVGSVCLGSAMSSIAAPVDPAERTIFLDPGVSMGSASSVAYHPGFDRYYGSNTGSSSVSAWVFGAAGGAFLQELNPLNVDPRAWNYNANTGQLEISSYAAATSGAGIVNPGVDGSGNLTGTTVVALPSPVAGIPDQQSAPAYDPVGNVLYARGDTTTVNVVNRADGSLQSSIVLDLASAGGATLPDDGVAFIPEENWLGVLDSDGDDLLVFDLSGTFVARIALDIDVTSASRRFSYANGQLFAFDPDRDVWQGYRVTDGGPEEPDPVDGPGANETGSALPVPVMSGYGLAAMVMGMLLLVSRRFQRK